MKTIDEILLELRQHKTCSRVQLYRYLKTLGIRPLGEIKQRPARYPTDTAARVIASLGLEENGEAGRPARIVSLRELKAERARSGARRGRNEKSGAV